MTISYNPGESDENAGLESKIDILLFKSQFYESLAAVIENLKNNCLNQMTGDTLLMGVWNFLQNLSNIDGI